MALDWIFRELQPGDKDRQSTVGQFFAGEATGTDARALVRESIQNSLDARLYGGNQPVEVRMRLARLSADLARPWFEAAWPHFLASDSGLDERPDPNNPCPFLAIEDFETTGLTGDVEHYRGPPPAENPNPFYYFFRTEGRSGKTEGTRGRWGIGKDVFRRSSRLHAFLTLTVRWDDKHRLMMGQAILNSHAVGNKYYKPDAEFGRPSKVHAGLVVPETDPVLLDKLASNFGLTRGPKQPGLSVVIPYVVPEIDVKSLLQETIRDYFYPILAGDLAVRVSDENKSSVVDKSTLRTVLAQLDQTFSDEMQPVLDLTEWALASKDRITLNKSEGTPKWDRTLFPDEAVEDAKSKFAAGERLAFRVPLTVKNKAQAKTRESHFDVFLVRDGSEHGRPIFIRGDIIIPDVRPQHLPGVRALVVAKHDGLANLLGDSEDPGHTQWLPKRDHFKAKYVGGPSFIDFVKQSAGMLVRYISEDDEPDKELLRDLFSIPVSTDAEDPKDKAKPKKRHKGKVPEEIIEVEPKRKRYVLTRVDGGFSIAPGDDEVPRLSKVSVRVAYDRRGGGKPLKHGTKGYSPFDFELNKAPIDVTCVGMAVNERDGNHLEATISDPNFRLTVTGFDPNRDLLVKVDLMEAADDPEV